MPEAQVGEDVIEFLARTISRNVRELEGGLNKLLAYAQLTGKPVTRTLAEEQLKDILSACRRRITIDEIQRAVCEYYRIDRSEMSSKRRARAVVRPLPPRSAYPSTARNSIRSRAWAAPLDGCSFQVRLLQGWWKGVLGAVSGAGVFGFGWTFGSSFRDVFGVWWCCCV